MNKTKLAEIGQFANKLFSEKLRTCGDFRSQAFINTVNETNEKFQTKFEVIELWKLIGGKIEENNKVAQ